MQYDNTASTPASASPGERKFTQDGIYHWGQCTRPQDILRWLATSASREDLIAADHAITEGLKRFPVRQQETIGGVFDSITNLIQIASGQ